MALACEPKLLIADEPTTALDVTIQAQILDLLRTMQKRLGLALLLITHDLGVVAEMADRVAVMYAGRIVEQAPVQELFADPQASIHEGTAGSIPGGAAGNAAACDPGHRAAARIAASRLLVHAPMPDRFEPCPTAHPGDTVFEHGRTVKCYLHGPAVELMKDAARPLLEVRNLTKEFTRKKGLFGTATSRAGRRRVTFDVAEGETFGLVGESGSGKTTTGRCILRLIEPTSGEVRFRGEDVLAFSKATDAAGAAGDADRLPGSLFVAQSAHASGDDRRGAAGHPPHGQQARTPGPGARAVRARRPRSIATDAISPQFSGGQRQRIGLARALALNPSLIIADEPVSALDVSVQAQVVNLLMDLQERLKLTYLFIAHDLRLVDTSAAGSP